MNFDIFEIILNLLHRAFYDLFEYEWLCWIISENITI